MALFLIFYKAKHGPIHDFLQRKTWPYSWFFTKQNIHNWVDNLRTCPIIYIDMASLFSTNSGPKSTKSPTLLLLKSYPRKRPDQPHLYHSWEQQWGCCTPVYSFSRERHLEDHSRSWFETLGLLWTVFSLCSILPSLFESKRTENKLQLQLQRLGVWGLVWGHNEA